MRFWLPEALVSAVQTKGEQNRGEIIVLSFGAYQIHKSKSFELEHPIISSCSQFWSIIKSQIKIICFRVHFSVRCRRKSTLFTLITFNCFADAETAMFDWPTGVKFSFNLLIFVHRQLWKAEVEIIDHYYSPLARREEKAPKLVQSRRHCKQGGKRKENWYGEEEEEERKKVWAENYQWVTPASDTALDFPFWEDWAARSEKGKGKRKEERWKVERKRKRRIVDAR